MITSKLMSPKNKKPNKANRTRLTQQQRNGKLLTPPLLSKDINLVPLAWRDNRLPEMLWAALLVTFLPRTKALNIFRSVSNCVHSIHSQKNEVISEVTHSALAELEPETLDALLNIIVFDEECRTILTPLLLLQKLPAKSSWQKRLNILPETDDWRILMRTVGHTLNHQSQEATDCRWLRIICFFASGRLIAPSDIIEDLDFYPDRGDMRQVGPTIRALELALTAQAEANNTWSRDFWDQCLLDTPCFRLPSPDVPLKTVIGVNREMERKTGGSYSSHYENNLRSLSPGLSVRRGRRCP